jgi:hypothetical protein
MGKQRAASRCAMCARAHPSVTSQDQTTLQTPMPVTPCHGYFRWSHRSLPCVTYLHMPACLLKDFPSCLGFLERGKTVGPNGTIGNRHNADGPLCC